jgi:hypothetical protein
MKVNEGTVYVAVAAKELPGIRAGNRKVTGIDAYTHPIYKQILAMGSLARVVHDLL